MILLIPPWAVGIKVWVRVGVTVNVGVVVRVGLGVCVGAGVSVIVGAGIRVFIARFLIIISCEVGELWIPFPTD